MLKKYALTSDCIDIMFGIKLYRIVALRAFGKVDAYELGGYVEDESNLSHEGDCWIGENAKVYGHATVTGSALVSGKAQVYGGAHITDHAFVCEAAQVCGGARIGGDLMIRKNAYVCLTDGLEVEPMKEKMTTVDEERK